MGNLFQVCPQRICLSLLCFQGVGISLDVGGEGLRVVKGSCLKGLVENEIRE